MKCKKCGNNETFFLYKKGFHTGIACENCGAFIKWASKDDVRLINYLNEKNVFYCEVQK